MLLARWRQAHAIMVGDAYAFRHNTLNFLPNPLTGSRLQFGGRFSEPLLLLGLVLTSALRLSLVSSHNRPRVVRRIL